MTEEAPEAVGPGSVVLDIGENTGAAVVTGPSSLAGREVEIRAANTAWDGQHAAFHVRETAIGQITAAVFPQLAQGDWEVRLRTTWESPVVSVAILGARVSTVALPGGTPD
jgi:hypothetical protein